MSILDGFDTRGEETELLASLLRNPGHAADITDAIDPADFSDPNHTELWTIARRLCADGRTPDVRALHREITGHDRRPVLEETLKRGMLAVGEGLDVAERVTRIRDARRRERLFQAGLRIQQHAANPAVDPDEAYARAVAALDVPDGGGDGPVPIGDLMARFLEAQQSVSADRVVPTPWPELNAALGGGLHRGRMYTIAARPGLGKSNVGLTVASHAAACAAGRGCPALVFSAEMSGVEVAGRWLSRTAEIDMGEIGAYDLSERSLAQARKLVESTDPLWVLDTPGMGIGAVAATGRRWHARHGVRLMVVDYLQLLDPDVKGTVREREVAAVSRRLKAMARELDVVMVVVAQLNRGTVDRRPVMSDLRESGQIEADSDAVILLYHPVHEDGNGSTLPTFEIELIVDKNRHGRRRTVTLEWAGEHATVR